MTKIFKRAAAGVMALAMCAGLTGCYSENNTWAAKMGDDTLPIGGYIYFLSSAYTEGAGKVGSEQEVLKADIDGKSGSQWVSDKAMDYLYSYYYVSQKFDELGLTLDEEDQDSIDSAVSYMWPSFKSRFEEMGVAESSFEQAYAVYNTKLTKLLAAMYGKGGEMEVSEDDMHEYYTGLYVYYQYMYADLSNTDEEGNSTDMTDDEKADVKAYLEDQAEFITKGELSIDEAAGNYATLHGTDPNTSGPASYKMENLSSVFFDALKPLKNGEAAVVETTSRYYVIQKLDIEDDFKALMEDETRLTGLLSEMKLEEFTEYTVEQGKALDIQVNTGAIGTVKASKVADIIGKNGTSSAESAESSASSESSGESSESGSESSESSDESGAAE